MNNYQTQGVILRRKNFFETDKMLWVYTRDRGNIKVIAKGARKTLSKLSGHVELFYLNNFQIVEGKNIDIVSNGHDDNITMATEEQPEAEFRPFSPDTVKRVYRNS